MNKEFEFDLFSYVSSFIRSQTCGSCGQKMKKTTITKKYNKGWRRTGFLSFESTDAEVTEKSVGFACDNCDLTVKSSSQPFRWSK